MTEHASELDVTHARQASRGRHAFVILATSLALVVIAFIVVWSAFAGKFAGRHGNREAPPQVAQSVSVTPNTVKQAAVSAPPGSVTAQTAGPAANRSAGG